VIVSSRPKRARTFQYTALLLYMLFLAFPLLWLLSVSFKGPRELVELHPHLIPREVTLSNYTDALHGNIGIGDVTLLHAAWNSTKVAILTSLLTTFVGLPAAYVLARTRGLLSRLGLGWILLSQMFPLILIIIPIFLLLRTLHLTDSHTGLIFVYVVWTLPFILWMLQSYVRGIPRDLEEAAMVDGASRITVLRTVIAPLLAPGIVVTALFAFITAWNEFFLALVLLQTPSLTTLPLLLARFVGVEGIVRLGPLAASALLATLPSLLLFTIIQRWLTRGLLSGAVKG
jgi:multiple sugar transport system permease protein